MFLLYFNFSLEEIIKNHAKTTKTIVFFILQLECPKTQKHLGCGAVFYRGVGHRGKVTFHITCVRGKDSSSSSIQWTRK